MDGAGVDCIMGCGDDATHVTAAALPLLPAGPCRRRPHPLPHTTRTRTPLRPPWLLQVAYTQINKMLSSGNTSLQGSLFWQWYGEGQEAPASEGGGRGLFGE